MPDREQVHGGPGGSAPFTVEVNRSYDPVQQSWDHQIFIKLYTTALETGFLAALSDRDWKTLCVIALHMDAEGRCYPSRSRIAKMLGVSQTTASARIQSLLDVRWNGQPLVRAMRTRLANGTLGRQVYTILPVVPLGFGPGARSPTVARDGPDVSDPAMLRNLDVVVERDQVKIVQHGDVPTWSATNMAALQHGDLLTSTNKNQDSNKSQEHPVSSLGQESLTTHRADPDEAIPNPGIKPDDTAHPTPRTQRRRPKPAAVSPAANEAAQYLQQQLRARGMTVFPRDWRLKAATKAQTILKAGLTPSDLQTVIDWCMAHEFWSDKVTTMDKVIDLVGQWQMQQKGGKSDGVRISRVATPRRHPNSGTLDALIES